MFDVPKGCQAMAMPQPGNVGRRDKLDVVVVVVGVVVVVIGLVEDQR